MPTPKYDTFSFRLDKRTITNLRKNRKKSGLSWNLFFNFLNTKSMGIFDAPQRKEMYDSAGNKEYDDTGVELNCESCGKLFLGQKWMITSKKAINCPNCWKNDNFSQEDQDKRL